MGVKYAVKCLNLGLITTEEELQHIQEKMFIMYQLNHPNIVRLNNIYDNELEIYLAQDLCLGGKFFNQLDE
eukprot:15366748-Ditylum_brightwellii.AAC.1